MILIDANVIMYAAGAEHPAKASSVAFLGRVAAGEVDACLDSETLQEILHRYRALHRWDDGRRAYDLTRRIFPEVLAVSAQIVDRARTLLDSYPSLMARDALHAAVVLEHGLRAICSFDRDFDLIDGITRIEP